ncbi:MAG: HAD hydrolase family protein, partial [Erysipelotrichaceae bacterium]
MGDYVTHYSYIHTGQNSSDTPVRILRIHRSKLSVIGSGNQYHLIKELFKDIIDEIDVISENGSLILENDQEIYATSLNKEELYRLCDGLSQYRVPYLICGKRSAYVLKRNGIDEFKDPKHFPKIEMIEKVEDIDDHI